MSDNVSVYLVIGNVILGGLWIISELMGMSSCEYNGVIQFIISDCACLGGKKIYIDIGVRHEEAIITINGAEPFHLPLTGSDVATIGSGSYL